jgi:NAD(P)-dependent dehydrogenase (short-subunit alcohol dehydrogenase family)
MAHQSTVLATGANRGLGLEVCRQLARRGLHVILTARTDAKAGEAAARLASDGVAVLHCGLDIADPGSAMRLADRLSSDGVLLDVLVNNGAIEMSGFDGEVARKTLATNFFGTVAVTDHLLSLVPDGGNIVMVSSGAGELTGYSPEVKARFLDAKLTRPALLAMAESFIEAVGRGTYREAGWPGSAYRVSKACLNAFTRILAAELAHRRIKVNAVCPGWVRTDMGGAAATRSIPEGAASIAWAATFGKDGPTGGFFRDGRAIAW